VTYEEALETAIEELDEVIRELKQDNWGWENIIESECAPLIAARDVLRKAIDQPKRKWVGLTKKEIESISDRVKPDPLMTEEPTWHIRFAQAVQRKLKEKNTELLSDA